MSLTKFLFDRSRIDVTEGYIHQCKVLNNRSFVKGDEK